MGEFADDCIEREFSEHLDERFGSPFGDDEDEYEESPLDGRTIRIEPKILGYKYKTIVRETELSWLIEMNAGKEKGATRWCSKKYCTLDKKKKILFIPEWLEQKILFGEVANAK